MSNEHAETRLLNETVYNYSFMVLRTTAINLAGSILYISGARIRVCSRTYVETVGKLGYR